MSSESSDPTHEPPAPSGLPEPVAVGQRVGDRYVIQALIGSGGMGLVYRAIEDEIEREVALKFIMVDANLPQVEREAYFERFRHEAQALGSLPPHPNRVVLYQYGQEQGTPYMAMELVRGESLTEVMRRGLSADRIVSTTRQLADALVDVHASGIVHRDLKPENLIITRSLLGDEQLKLIDFGIARSPVKVEQGEEEGEEREILGTVLFMAPELLLDGVQDARTDIYAIGVVLFELVTGQGPFDHLTDADDDVEVIMRHHVDSPPGPIVPRSGVGELPVGFEGLILRCLAKKPEDRFSDASELRRALDLIARPRPRFGTGQQRIMSREDADTVADEIDDTSMADIRMVPSEDVGFPVVATAICGLQDLVAAADLSGEVRIWDYKSGTEIHYIPSPDGREPTTAALTRLAFSPDGSLLAIGDRIGQLWLVDVDLHTRDRIQLSRGGPLALAFDRATTLMVVATTAGTLELWDVPNRKQLAVLIVDLPRGKSDEGKEGDAPHWRLKSLALSPHRHFLAAGTDTGVVYVWNFKDRTRTGPMAPRPPVPGQPPVEPAACAYLCFSPDDARVAALRDTGEIEIWDPVERTIIKSLQLSEQGVPRRMTFSPDGTQLLVTFDSGAIVLVDVEGGEVLETIRIPRGTATNLSFTRDDVPMASIGSGSTVQVWDLMRLGRVRTLGPYPTRLLDVTIAPFGDTCLTLAAGGQIDRWDLCTGRHLGRQRVPAHTVKELHKAPEIDRVLMCGPREGLLAFEGVATNSNAPLHQVELPIPDPDPDERMVTYTISPDARLVALGYTSGEARIYGYKEPSEPAIIESAAGAITTLAFAPDNQVLAVADEGGCVRLWDVVAGQVEWEEHSGRLPIRMVAFAPSGRLLSIPRGNNIEIWNLQTRRRVARLVGHDGPIRTLVHGLGGRILLSASNDGTARLWDVAQQRVLRVLDDHPGPVTAATLDPRMRFLMTTSGPYLSVWRVSDAELLARFAYCGKQSVGEAEDTIDRHDWIAFTPEGRFTASTLSPPNILMTRPGSRVRLDEADREGLFDPRAVAARLLDT